MSNQNTTNNQSLPAESNPTWSNWSGNITHKPSASGENYYFAPKTLSELKTVVQQAKAKNATLRASGQRHSQPPLVIGDNSGDGSSQTINYLVDMSCYSDLGENGDQNMVLDAEKKQLTINTGVREDDVDFLLTKNNFMMRTVTAGGFFSLGGMTSVDVNGATIDAPIFSGTISAFTILKADGTVITIDESTAKVGDWSPINFARVNLGGLGIVTSVVLDVMDRPYATTIEGGVTKFSASSKSKFVDKFQQLLTEHDRIESFYNPFAVRYITDEFLCAWWDVNNDPSNKIPNQPIPAEMACTLAAEDKYGAPFINLYKPAVDAGILAQSSKILAGALITAGMLTVESQVNTANGKHSDLWLTEAVPVMFMSYYLELPGINQAGLEKVYDALQVVGKPMAQGSPFYIAAPMEFRFITGSEVAMAGTYTENPDAIFVNLDLIGFVEATPSSQYSSTLLQFFADVERAWVAMGGFPHNGKMYGFYDPDGPAGNHSAAFNPNFLANLRQRRGARLEAFNAYRASMDPDGLFYNDYLRALLEG